jgi:hypothetical protein
LQTAEHILAKVIENNIKNAKVVIAKFKEEATQKKLENSGYYQ